MLAKVDSTTAIERSKTLFCGQQFPRISVRPQTQQYMNQSEKIHGALVPPNKMNWVPHFWPNLPEVGS